MSTEPQAWVAQEVLVANKAAQATVKMLTSEQTDPEALVPQAFRLNAFTK